MNGDGIPLTPACGPLSLRKDLLDEVLEVREIDTMHWLTWAFLIALSAETVARLWLASRQIAAVGAHRDEVPAPFRGQIEIGRAHV